MDWETILLVFLPLCALGAMHVLGMVHFPTDIEPAHILSMTSIDLSLNR